MLSRTQNSSAGEKNLSFHQIFIFFLFYYEIHANHLTTKTLGHSTVSKDCSPGRRPLNALPSSAEKRTIILITNTHIKEKEAGL
jgi:hypothetical protein